MIKQEKKNVHNTKGLQKWNVHILSMG